jgi:hypothetical protein
MEFPDPTQEFQIKLDPVYVSPYTYRARLPMIGQYIYNLTVSLKGNRFPRYSVTLELDDIHGNPVNISKLYSNDNCRNTVFDFFKSPLPLVTEALYKTTGAHVRIEFLDRYPDNYTVTCMVGYVDDNYIKEQFRTRQLPTLTANGNLLNYYDGLLWIP